MEALKRMVQRSMQQDGHALACGVEGADELVLGVGRVGLSKHLMCHRSFGEAGHGARPDGRAQEARQVLVRTLDVFAVRHVCNGSDFFFLAVEIGGCSHHTAGMANAERADPSGYADFHTDEIAQTGEHFGLQKQEAELRVRKQALLRARREESSVNAPHRPSGQNSHSDWPKDTLTHAATGPRCKHCNVQLVPLTPAKNCCSPGGGCVCQAAPACEHCVGVLRMTLPSRVRTPFVVLFFWRSSLPLAEPFVATVLPRTESRNCS